MAEFCPAFLSCQAECKVGLKALARNGLDTRIQAELLSYRYISQPLQDAG